MKIYKPGYKLPLYNNYKFLRIDFDIPDTYESDTNGHLIKDKKYNRKDSAYVTNQ